jgi:predicted O-methyltransferase YrrM
MMKTVWEEVDGYLGEMLAPSDSVLDATLAANRAAGLPPIDVSRLQGKFLELLVRISGAKRVLEIGTLGGYSTIWFARAIGAAGRVVTLEVNASYADVARSNLQRAGLLERVDLRVGQATETLSLLHQEGTVPFDLIFIDADKPNNPRYLEWALKLSRTGTVMIFDNVVRDGNVIDSDSRDANVLGVRECITMLKAHPRLSATALQTVGAKGYDGFALAVVTS